MGNMVSLKKGDCVGRDQSHAVMSALALNVDWDTIPKTVAQAVVADPIGAGRQFTLFLQNGGRMAIMTTDGIVLPPGAKMHIVTVMVDESRPWDESVNAGGPNTGVDWDIRKVGDQYPPTAGAKPKMRIIYLINFGKDTLGDDNIAWAKGQKLHPETPRGVFAVAEENPNLDETLGMKGCMAVVSLKECSFGGCRRAPIAWWIVAARRAFLDSFDGVWLDNRWFAFSREV